MFERYLAFAGNLYYPFGGWKDFQGSFNTISDARKTLIASVDNWAGCGYGWWHVIDSENSVIVASGEYEWGLFSETVTHNDAQGSSR